MPGDRNYDIAILGGGVLGISIYYWLTRNPDLKVVLLEKEKEVAFHTSSRNTGVIHRPFYLDPRKRKFQIASSRVSYGLWKELAEKSKAPWNQCGTIEIANTNQAVKALEKYGKWAQENGLTSQEFELLNGREVSNIEPEVSCEQAIHSKTDVSTDFGYLTKQLLEHGGNKNSAVLFDMEVKSVRETNNGATILLKSQTENTLSVKTFINAAGGSALRIAHRLGYAREYSQIFFRGEYWRVQDKFGAKISRNIYSVPKHQGYPFLDPHFIVRASGQREIGPNAVLVSGPEVYSGISGKSANLISMLLSEPVEPKFRLAFNKEFLHLVSGEWKSSLYKSEMAKRVQKFIPNLNTGLLNGRGIAGVRASLIDDKGFAPDAIPVFGKSSLHILNYNSPGATGAPAFAAYLIDELRSRGYISGRAEFTPDTLNLWDYNKVVNSLNT